VISERPLHELVPVENAAMPDRTIIQWDKDDLDTLGLLKVDCLALGMLSCIRRCLELVNGWEKRESGIGNRESEKPLARTPVPASPRTALPIPHSPFPIPAPPIPHSRFPIPQAKPKPPSPTRAPTNSSIARC
jgi:hypothetical protein